MATLSFELRGKTEQAHIYVRFSIDRDNVLRRNSGYTINPKDWSTKTKSPKQTNPELKNLRFDLENLKTSLLKSYNDSLGKKESISSEWLQTQINHITGKKDNADPDRLTNCIQTYIDYLPYKQSRNGSIGVTDRTIQRHKRLKQLIEQFEKSKKKRYYLKDVNLNFSNRFIQFLNSKEYAENYIGTLIKALKTVCNHAQTNGFEVNHQLSAIKSFKAEVPKNILTETELQQIELTQFTRDALDNARDWLIIGCHIGQRVSDLLKLTHKNITVKSGIKLIELTQQKTGKRVAIPLHPKVQEILDKNGGQFPRKISDQKFNVYIKDIAKLAGLDTPTSGAIMNPETKRKESSTFPKWQLVSSHICRRSFATNNYNLIPTPLLISITGHSTESQFLEYIGKTATDQALQLAEYWTKETLSNQKQQVMQVEKKAN